MQLQYKKTCLLSVVIAQLYCGKCVCKFALHTTLWLNTNPALNFALRKFEGTDDLKKKTNNQNVFPSPTWPLSVYGE